MLPDKIMQSDLLDILFENRNKAYGAYALRKSYNKTMASAITITIFIATIFSIFQLTHHTKNQEMVRNFIIPPDQELSKINPVKALPAKPAQHAAANHIKQIISTPPVIVSDDKKTDMPTTNELDKANIGEANINGDAATGIIEPLPYLTEGTGTVETAAVVIKDDDGPLNNAQVMPEYPGGLEALRKFMIRNLKQPDNLEAGEKIIVRACFIVDKHGQIEGVKIINSGRADLDKEVQRVINKMPLWKPGLQNGNTVAVYFNLPVTFMNDEEQ